MTTIEFDRRCGTDDVAECARQMGGAWISATNPHRIRVDADRATVEDWLEDEGFCLAELTITGD